MAITKAQADEFKFALKHELESHLWEFIKSYAGQLADVDGDYQEIRDDLIEVQKDLTISF